MKLFKREAWADALAETRQSYSDLVLLTSALPLKARDPGQRERTEKGQLAAVPFFQVVCARLGGEDVMFLDLASRLAKTLLRLSGVEPGALDASEQRVSVTQLDLANMIGMSRESTNKQLRNWEKRKLLRLERSAVVILSPGAMSLIAEGEPGSRTSTAESSTRRR